MNMGTKNAVARFVLVILIIALMISVAVCGYEPMGISSLFEKGGITLGLDLSGGSIIVYEAQTDMTGSELKSNMEAVEAMMRQRLDNLGYTEATVSLQSTNQIRVEIPSITDPEDAVQKIGATAVIEFKNDSGDLIIDGKDIKKAESMYGAIDNSGTYTHFVALSLTDEGQRKFTEGTKAAAGSYISIYLDGKLQSSPYVDSSYSKTGIEGDPIISNLTDGETAKWLASIISAGRLPFELKDVELRSVGPTLGENSLRLSIIAGAIGLGLVMLFMIIIYRLSGVAATVSLVTYTALDLILLSIFKANLTLPGIAGIILSIGMAVDANVVIFERIKEELLLGKSMKAALKAGFSNAFWAVFDSNITTLIAAVVLWIFGTGTIKGFAVTLTIGVAVSFFTAVTLTKYLMKLVMNMGTTNKLWWYGVNKKEAAK